MNVSVIIPIYNAAPFIVKAVESALACPEVKEVLLIEDYSQDKSLEICKLLDQRFPNVRLFRTDSGINQGASAARNIGMQHAEMEYLAFLDADDYYLPSRFKVDKEVFADCKDAGGVYNAIGVHFYSKDVERDYKRCLKNEITVLEGVRGPEQLFDSLIGNRRIKGDKVTGNIHLNGLTLKTELVMESGIKFNPDLQFHEDTEFIIRLAHNYMLYPGSISEPVAVRGVHEGNRITKHLHNTDALSKSRNLLWQSVHKWSIDKNLSSEQNTCIYTKYLLTRILKSGKIKACIYLPAYIYLSRGEILFRHYSKIQAAILGDGIISRFVFTVIRRLFRFLKIIKSGTGRSFN
jgi:glycosyltransferase involved in cell wall biosynthesis